MMNINMYNGEIKELNKKLSIMGLLRTIDIDIKVAINIFKMFVLNKW